MNINLSYFFTPANFPWKLIGIDAPAYGPAHLYVCKIMAPYAGQDARFLRGKPALYELAKFSENSIIEDIYKYFRQVEATKDVYNPTPLDKEIIYYLSSCPEFREDLTIRLTKAHMNGDTLPPAALYNYGNEYSYV